MLQVARLGPKLLGDAARSVESFFQEQLNQDGGAKDRAGQSDLYYTVFTLEGLAALQADVPYERVESFLRGFDGGESLDPVHLACLARCWASLPKGALSPARSARIADNLARFRSDDGGFGPTVDAATGNIYNVFLAFGAYQDLGRECPNVESIPRMLERTRAADGAYSSMAENPHGITTLSAAAVAVLHQLRAPIPDEIGPWLLARLHGEGGFRAAPHTPMPDLLSTAVALHALVTLKVDIDPIKEACLDFIDTLWTGRGFCGHWADDVVDAEYTGYALLALGHLSL